eukprot:gnl/TRDRNA2_/TRDRNA2_149958_c0_seq1.p1 gnl/TRDRNA2_/TRDRNA2_149958_c0~~gnl/TRDRNA2_/TRDRNA2_149958_c0_seq1.p1  ORF type:complete len:428 (+),score=61.63 gnl/TRDRNA2_/TRDRNA2_149958_c0_seq1:133-1284(+)
MCPNLLKRGFFDAPLIHDTVPRVGNSTKSALDYCYDLLRPGGFCERTLPSTYTVWKSESVHECGGPILNPFTFKHPVTKEEKSLLAVDYEARQRYEDVQGRFFIVYKSLVIGIWILAMVYEARFIFLTFNWVLVYPHSEDGSDAVEKHDENGTVKFTIHKTTMSIRLMVAAMTAARFVMLTVLAVVGTTLLLRSTSYMSIIMDGVALVFILEIATLLYTQVVRLKAQEEMDLHVDPMPVEHTAMCPEFLRKSAGLQDVFLLGLVFLIVILVMYFYYTETVEPLYDALQCTCVTKGRNCREAQLFDYDFWYEYWNKTTPAIFHDIDRIKASGHSHSHKHARAHAGQHAAGPAPALAAGPAPAAVNLLQRVAGAAIGALKPLGEA